MGGKRGGSGTPPPQQVRSEVTQSRLPEYARPYYQKMMQRGEALLGEQYQPYQGQRIAGFQPEQLGAFQGIQAIANRGLPGIDQARRTAMDLTGGRRGPQVRSDYRAGELGDLYTATPAQRGYDAGTIDRGYDAGPISTDYRGREFGRERIKDTMQDYESPYRTKVLDRLQRRATQRADEAKAKRGLEAAQQGAFGGSRHGVEQFLADRDLEERLTDIEAQQLQRGFEQAAGLAGQDIQQGMRAGQLTDASRRAAAQMGLTAQQAAEQARQVQGRMGLTAQQQTEQARQMQGRLGLTAQQQTEQARQAQGRLGLGGYQAQQQAQQAQGRMGLQAQMANQRAFQEMQRRRLSAAGMLPQIAGREQQLDLSRMRALQGVGGQFQQQRQAQLEQGYRDFMNQRDYPREQLSFYSSLLQGLPVQPTVERQQYQPRANPYAQALNMGLGGLSLLGGRGGMG
jgi:hypothetical protein